MVAHTGFAIKGQKSDFSFKTVRNGLSPKFRCTRKISSNYSPLNPVYQQVISKTLALAYEWDSDKRTNDHTIAIKSATTNNRKGRSDNADPKIRNSVCVTLLLTLLLAPKQSLRVRIRALRGSATAQLKGHTPLLIFGYLSLSYSGRVE